MHAYRSSGRQPDEDDYLSGRLGLQISEHRSTYRMLWMGVATIAIFALFAVALTSSTVMFVLLLIAAIVGAAWVGAFLALTPTRIAVHEHGILVDRRIGRPVHLLFDDCRSVFYDYEVASTIAGTGVTSSELRLEDGSGETLTLSAGVTEAATMFAQIDRLCVKPIAREAFHAYDAGEILRFGLVALSTEGLGVKGELKSWSDVRKVQVSPKGFWFHFRGHLLGTFVAFSKVPYAFTLVELLETAGCELEFIEGFVRR